MAARNMTTRNVGNASSNRNDGNPIIEGASQRHSSIGRRAAILNAIRVRAAQTRAAKLRVSQIRGPFPHQQVLRALQISSLGHRAAQTRDTYSHWFGGPSAGAW